MNGVLGMTELLLGTALTERQRRFAESVRQSGETLLAIINDVLDFSKIEAGKLELEQGDFDVRQLVEEVVELFAERAYSKGLELACFLDDTVPAAVRGDGVRLRQIFTNLVGNAIKFTAQGEVIVRVMSAAPERLTRSPCGVKCRIPVSVLPQRLKNASLRSLRKLTVRPHGIMAVRA